MKPKTYRLRKGFTHTHGDRELKPGDTVKLTEDQAKAFSDRFVEVGSKQEQEEEEEIPVLNPEGTEPSDDQKSQGPPAL